MADQAAIVRLVNEEQKVPGGARRCPPPPESSAPFPGPEWEDEDDMTIEWDEDWAWDEMEDLWRDETLRIPQPEEIAVPVCCENKTVVPKRRLELLLGCPN